MVETERGGCFLLAVNMKTAAFFTEEDDDDDEEEESGDDEDDNSTKTLFLVSPSNIEDAIAGAEKPGSPTDAGGIFLGSPLLRLTDMRLQREFKVVN